MAETKLDAPRPDTKPKVESKDDHVAHIAALAQTLTSVTPSGAETVRDKILMHVAAIQDPTAHLNCYRIRRAPRTPAFVPRIVQVGNQFGAAQSLELTGRADLCVPAEKDGVASTLDVNHYKCYRAQIAEGQPAFLNRFVFLQDQFEGKQTVVKRPWLVCNPVDKNGEGILDSNLALACYRIRQERGQPRFTRRIIQVEDQFSDGQPVSTRASKVSMLCLPSTVVVPPPPPTPTPTPTATPTPTPTPTPYGSAMRAFLEPSKSLIE